MLNLKLQAAQPQGIYSIEERINLVAELLDKDDPRRAEFFPR